MTHAVSPYVLLDISLHLPFNRVQDVEKGNSRCFESQRDHKREHVGHYEIAKYHDDLEQNQSA
jgi:hypothetical protein